MTHESCDCLKQFNEMLKERNTEIDVTFSLPRDGQPMSVRPKIATSKIETRKRIGPVIAAPTFCPFCGEPYEPQRAKASGAIYQRLFDASVRIEGMWPFPVSPASEALASIFEFTDEEDDLPQQLRDLLRSADERTRADLYDSSASDFHDAFDELCALAARKKVQGWIGIAANPVPKPVGQGSVSFSWGYYATKVLFAATAEQLLDDAAAWGEAIFAAAHEQALAKGGAA